MYAGDYRLLCKDRSIRETEFRSVANILPGLHLAIVRDVTDRKRAEAELRRSQRLLEEAQKVAHLGHWEWDLESNSLTWSAEIYRLFGVRPDAFTPSFASFLERLHPEDRDFVHELNERTIRDGGSFAYDARIVQQSGEQRYMRARGSAERDPGGKVTRRMGIAPDISTFKRDQEVRARLLDRVLTIQEEERAHLSRELHDGAGQALAALLVGLRHVEDARSLAAARLAASRQRDLVAKTIDELGRLARGLRPTVLDDLGLRAALKRYASTQAKLFAFEVELDATSLGGHRLPKPIETTLFRVTQEALTNAARHAGARRVRIVVTRDRDRVRLEVTDDGRGFDAAGELDAGVHLGLHGIRERATLAGGRAEIRSVPGKGTSVTVALPLPRHRSANPVRSHPRAQASRRCGQ
jgi:PAS domain S-box-containing protein